jgi:hypothetical protein
MLCSDPATKILSNEIVSQIGKECDSCAGQMPFPCPLVMQIDCDGIEQLTGKNSHLCWLLVASLKVGLLFLWSAPPFQFLSEFCVQTCGKFGIK